MLILSLHSGPHDSSAALFDDYRVLAAVAEERMNRVKGSGGFPEQSIAEVLGIAGVTRRDVDVLVCTRAFFLRRYFTYWRGHEKLREGLRRLTGHEKMREMNVVVSKLGRRADDVFDSAAFLADLGLRPDVKLYFSNHHFSHALPSLFFTDWEEALLYTADGSGDQVYYSHNLLRDGTLTNLYGDDRWLGRARPSGSLGLAYGYVTEALGFRMNRHEGKLTGLAAYGEPTLLPQMQQHFSIADDGRIDMDFVDDVALRNGFRALVQPETRENAAASVQALLEWGIRESVGRLLQRHGVRRLGLAGGVFANVRLNRVLTETLSVDEVFVVPPMGDDGLVIGGALQFLLQRDGLDSWLGRRYRLSDVYWGATGDADAFARVATTGGAVRHAGDPAALAAEWLAAGRIGAVYHGRMEYGPRALGARSILASPANAAVNQTLNDRLQRSEFMPFAPVVSEGEAAAVFDIGPVNRYAAQFMTICCAVQPEWRERIPAVVHIDGSARPQIIKRAEHPLYFDILRGFTAHTGLPVLVNTSFNVHEEPIVNRPEECLKALADGRVDFVATADAVWTRTAS
ncbi:MAG TPA: carbamoyltransferase C-terminal domain-containing protein [Stellaceae bacterium]|jgi:carbamoyltransferase|nr:carbamoyltransferase C-terminal domain-containing protein [Stellaceae bacterium]